MGIWIRGSPSDALHCTTSNHRRKHSSGANLSGVAPCDVMQDWRGEAEVMECQTMLLQQLWDQVLLQKHTRMSRSLGRRLVHLPQQVCMLSMPSWIFCNIVMLGKDRRTNLTIQPAQALKWPLKDGSSSGTLQNIVLQSRILYGRPRDCVSSGHLVSSLFDENASMATTMRLIMKNCSSCRDETQPPGHLLTQPDT